MNNNTSAQTVKSICQISKAELRFNALIPECSGKMLGSFAVNCVLSNLLCFNSSK